jgi:signal transduction protein with GAF and PtsI domain
MENQLEQLEDCLKRLILNFNTVRTEKERLSKQVILLKDQLHKQVTTAQLEHDELIRQHEQEKFHLQEIMQARIDDLIQDNKRFKSVLENSKADLQQLLQRLPVSQEVK